MMILRFSGLQTKHLRDITRIQIWIGIPTINYNITIVRNLPLTIVSNNSKWVY